jgi:Mg-chelatase subunit ChlD
VQVIKRILIVFGFLAAAFAMDITASAPQSDQEEENLTFPDDDQAAPDENLTFPDENLTFPDENLTDSDSVSGLKPEVPPTSANKLKAITLAPLLKEGALPEQEPNDKFEQAMEVPAPFKVIGQIKGREDDIFRIRAVGKPRLWSLHADGETIRQVSLLDASKRNLVSQRPAYGENSVTLNGLYLLPGWHWVKVTGKGTVDGEYVFQATPGDPPFPASEREPNNDKSRAQRLRFDQEIKGIYAPGDDDYYRFSMSAPALVRISIQPAEGMTVNLSGFANSASRSTTPGETLQYDVPLEPGDYSFRLRLKGKVAGPQPYRLLMERLSLFEKEKATDAAPDASLSLVLDGYDKAVKAFWDEGQHFNLGLTVVNNGATPREISLSSASSHYLWKPTAKSTSVTLNPGQTQRIPVAVEIGAQTPADEKVRIAVQAKSIDGTVNETSVDIAALCDADPADPHLAQPLPRSMLGGVNLAWASLGGFLPDVEEKKRNDPGRYMGIIDGYTPLSTSWKRDGDFPFDVPLNLAATGSILGITVDPTGCPKRGGAVRDFELLSSSDGQLFESVLEGTLGTAGREQVFSFPNPVLSGFLKLRVRSTWQNANKGRLCLGELKAVADPNSDFSGGEGWNIARPELGGHVVWSSLKAANSTWAQVLSDKKTKDSVVADPGNPNEWVVGFHHNRAAQVREIRWLRQVGSRVPNEFSQVDIAVSVASPLGPWQSVGPVKVDKAKEISSISFDKPVWARFVRFSSTDPDKAGRWQLPGTLQILERPAGDGYRSMLGEWGHYEKNSVFEYLADERSATNSKDKFVTGNASKAKARSLTSGNEVSGQVQRGKDEDWYKLSVPQGQNRLRLVLSGLPTVLVEPQLVDGNGVSVPINAGDKDATRADYSADVTPGDYLLRVFEPIMSTIVTWDNSGSVSPYAVGIYQALDEFARGVAPQTELVNFLPFQEKQYDLLRKEWTDQPFVLAEALNNYDRADSSSYAEGNLHAATKYLQKEQGNKMVLILTDAASGNRDNRKLWQSLSKVMPHVFSVELHGRGNFAYQQDKMQDWADVNGGVYSFFRTQPDLDTALERALCTMRRPVGYSLVVQSEYQKPRGPGSLRVKVDPGAASSSAVEIILDASGSMYKKIGDQTRIDVAKTVLTDLLQTTIPAGTPLALRIYGHKEPRSCRTDLELPLKPLVTADALTIIKSVDPQDRSRTPLADSLKMVTKDLEGADGAKLVILLTDGEESCDGDPEEAVRDLKEQGMDVKLNIVGMAIDSDAAKQQFAELAKIGGGLYFDADSPEALKSALEKALFPKYQLIDQNGDVTVEGVADGVSVEIAEGVYQLKVLTTPAQSMGEVRIEEGKTIEIIVGSK